MGKEYKPINNLWKDSEGYRYFGTLKLSSKIKYDGDDFIPLWECVKLLQEELEEYKNPIKYFKYANKNVTDENKKLKDNWNKLKEYIRGTKLKEFEKSYGKRNGRTFTQAEIVVCNMILNKMQELEKGDSDEI